MTTSAEVAREVRSAERVPAASPRDPVVATLWSRLATYQTSLLAAVLIVVLAALVLPPFVFLLKASVVDAQRGGEWSLANFEAVLGSRRVEPWPGQGCGCAARGKRARWGAEASRVVEPAGEETKPGGGVDASLV